MQNELSLDENIALARQFVSEQFVSRGMIADFSIHQPDEKDGGIPNCRASNIYSQRLRSRVKIKYPFDKHISESVLQETARFFLAYPYEWVIMEQQLKKEETHPAKIRFLPNQNPSWFLT